MPTPQKTIQALPDPTDECPNQWSIVAKADIPELWGAYRRGKARHNNRFVYPCADKKQALDLLRSLLETRKFYDLRMAQSKHALGLKK